MVEQPGVDPDLVPYQSTVRTTYTIAQWCLDSESNRGISLFRAALHRLSYLDMVLRTGVEPVHLSDISRTPSPTWPTQHVNLVQ